jgi:predicted ATPase with chaperone activity
LPAPQPSMSDVIGQWQAKRALLIAAAGGHSMLLILTTRPHKSRVNLCDNRHLRLCK